MTRSHAAVEPAFGFRLEASQNKYLLEGEGELTAIISVTATGLAPPAELAAVVIVDCSGSMNAPQTKMIAARRATVAALDTLPDGSAFAVVQGTKHAAVVYPPEQRLAVMSPETRVEAQRAVRQLTAAGGTAIGSWLDRARELLDARPTGVRHAILLTDGKNEHEDPGELGRVLAACAGRLTCDVRAVGDGWDPTEVHRIAAALHGSAEEVHERDLAADFRTMVEGATGKVVPDLRLTVRTTVPTARIRTFRQVVPMERDLTADAVTLDDRTSEFAVGSWGVQAADYELTVSVDAANYRSFMDVQVALVGLRPVGAGEVSGGDPVPVLAHWTNDVSLSVRIDPKVSSVLGQDALRRAVAAGCDAYTRGDHVRAAEELGAAVRLAHATGNDKNLRRLRALVHIDDAATGSVRIRDDVTLGALLSAALTARSRVPGPGRAVEPDQPAVGPPDGPDRECPECGLVSPGTARFCTGCRRSLVDAP